MASSAAKVVATWLRVPSFSGCRFVQQLVSTEQARADFAPLGPEVPSRLSRHLTTCASLGKVAIAAFPTIADEGGICELIEHLSTADGWKCAEVPWPGERLMVAVRWRTGEGRWSKAMGIAPLLSMPPTRRAPYVALAVWPGEAVRSREPDVAFIDIPTPFATEQEHKQALHVTEAEVKGILGDEASESWREVAFSLPGACRPRLAGKLE